MKAVDPSIRIGAVLTAPGNWPDGQTNDASPKPWNDSVLSIACNALDFVSIHWYAQGPTGETDSGLLAAPQSGAATPVSYTPSIPSLIASLKAQLAEHCGAHANAVQIMVTETNSVSYNPGKQTTSVVNSLFLADQVMTWLENGVTNVDWWAVHNSPFDGNADPALYGDYQFGDYGFLSRGLTSDNGAVEPPAETPFPTFYGMQMLSHLGHQARSQVLGVSSSTPLVSIHAVKQPSGKVHVLLINKSPSETYDVAVALNDASVRGVAKVFSYGKDAASIQKSSQRVQGSSFSVKVAPYSMTTVKLP
jgi:alpha-L-arabinofuranosidase